MRFSCCVFIVACGVAPAAAQEVPLIDIQPARHFAEPFTRIRGVRELSTGSVLISDQTERAVYRINFETGEYVQIGREGSGPEEYRQPLGLYPLPGDSSLLLDLGNGRLAVLSPDGVFGETYPTSSDGYFRVSVQADTVGNLFWRHDGSLVLRMDRHTGRIDTVTTLEPPDTYLENGRSRTVAFSVSDWWAVSWDGQVAVARHTPYRIDWYGLDGSEVQGPAVVYEPFPVRSQERRAWEERPRSRMAVGGGSGRAAPPKDRFPDHLPPFEWREVYTTPEGGVWVRRAQPAGVTRQLFDVFDSLGRRIRQVRLPEGRDVVGFGRGSMYATREDEDGLLWLEIYRR
jgi:hypothetical protein